MRTTTVRPRSRLLATLNGEWLDLAERPHPWTGDAQLGDGTWADLLVRIAERPDAVLGQLLARCAAGDARAGRVVVQAMLGKMVLFARADPRHPVDDYVAELWIRIGTYPLARRPHRIAANLALDTRKAVAGRPSPEDPMDPASLESPATSEDAWRLADVLAVARSLRLVDERTSQCLVAVYGWGLRSHEAAEMLACTPALVRYRTSRAVRTLSAHAGDILAAAA